MNIKEVESYNKKTKTLTLITKIKNKKEKTVETKVYEYPFFVEGDYTQEALGLGNELEENEYQVSLDLFERLTKFFVGLYGNQFTEEELAKGINQNEIIDRYVEMLFGVLRADPDSAGDINVE